MKEYPEINTGVIGIGSMGQNHVRIYNEVSNLVGIADPDEDKGKFLSEKFGVKWFNNYEDLLPLVDAVSVATPTKYHCQISTKVAESGVNLLVEKPLARSSKEALNIISAAKKEQISLAVGHVERHNPVIEYAKKKIDDKSWGGLVSLFSRRLSPYPIRISDVGVVLDLSVHDIDIMSYIFGSYPISVYCSGASHKGVHEDYVIITLNYGDGRIGICENSWLSLSKTRTLEVNCSNQSVILDFISQSAIVGTQEVDIIKAEPLKKEILDFLRSIRQNGSPLVTGADGLMVVEVAKAVLESLKKNKVIKL